MPFIYSGSIHSPYPKMRTYAQHNPHTAHGHTGGILHVRLSGDGEQIDYGAQCHIIEYYNKNLLRLEYIMANAVRVLLFFLFSAAPPHSSHPTLRSPIITL
jgi:hypothetical protein